MNSASRDKNVRYFDYLLQAGIIDSEQHEIVLERCKGSEEKQILFEISNFFSNFTASDWFDLSCRIYSHWQKHHSDNPNSHRHTVQSRKTNDNNEHLRSQNGQEYTLGDERRGNVNKNVKSDKHFREQPTKPSAQKSSNNEQRQTVESQGQYRLTSNEEAENKLHRLNDILSTHSVKEGFEHVREFSEDLKQMINVYTSSNGGKTQWTPNKQEDSTAYNEAAGKVYAEQDTHSKLYYDYFQKRIQMELRRELQKTNELENCTFVPQINPVDATNDNLISNLRVPVYERLLQVKQVPANVMLEKQEYRELKGATFHPDISKSQKKYNLDRETSPEDRKREAVERLYSDAQIKEKLLYLKRLNKREQEVEGCTFSPNILSPSKDKENLQRVDLTKSVDRLYDENLRRHRKLLRREVEIREQELEGCTFQPERRARNFRMRNEDEYNSIAVHDRLYESSKKREQRIEEHQNHHNHLEYMHEAGSGANSNHYRSPKANDRTANRSPNYNGAIEEEYPVITPAFDRLYKDMMTRKVKMQKLREKVTKEEGATFQPKTNWSKKGKRPLSVMNRSYQDGIISSRHESRAQGEPYNNNNNNENIHHYRRDSENIDENAYNNANIASEYDRRAMQATVGRRQLY